MKSNFPSLIFLLISSLMVPWTQSMLVPFFSASIVFRLASSWSKAINRCTRLFCIATEFAASRKCPQATESISAFWTLFTISSNNWANNFRRQRTDSAAGRLTIYSQTALPIKLALSNSASWEGWRYMKSSRTASPGYPRGFEKPRRVNGSWWSKIESDDWDRHSHKSIARIPWYSHSASYTNRQTTIPFLGL